MFILDEKSHAETLFYSGTYKEHKFTLIANYDDESEGVDLVILWKGEEFENQKEIEKEIKKLYLER